MNITLTGSAGSLTFDESDIVASNGVRATKTHTGISDFQITLTGNRDVESFAARQDQILIEVESGTEFIGYITDANHNIRAGRTSISGYGIGKRLEETRPGYESLGGSLTYSNISVQEALRDYWGRTEFDNYTVYDQPLETVATNELVQSADTQSEWQSLLEPIADTTPVEITTTGPTSLQSSFVTEGENSPNSDSLVPEEDPEYSNGEAKRLTVSSHFAEYPFSVDYTIPDGEFEAWLRFVTPQGQNTATSQWTLEDSGGTVIAQSDETSVGAASLGWTEIGDTWNLPNPGELQPGDYTLRFDIIDDTNQAAYDLDVVASLDSLTRFTGGSDATSGYTFDNDNGGSSGYLDGPELFPPSITITTEIDPVSFNIASSNLDSVWNDTSNNQSISVSNDGSTTYTTFNNTQTVDHSYTDAGRELKTQFTLSRYGDRTSATPQTGYLAQEIDSVEHRVDGDSLSVIVDLELSKNHFDNLQTLHSKGEFVWNIEHDNKDIADLKVESFKRGSQSKTLPVEDEIESNPEIAAENYYNTIYLQGSLVNGTRPVAEVQDTDAVNNDGRVISPGVLRDLNITTEPGAKFRARALLDRASQNNALRGTKTYPADFSIQPGFSYDVDFQGVDGWGSNWGTDWGNTTTEFTLEEVALRYNGNEATVQLDFVPRSSLSEDISELKRNSRQQSDRV